ncbi:ATP-binding protein [Streptomyces sp. MS06]|uniref:ATP-binding protein n=1 Tax=Streptomyces sp. MS06 TaxID=3385974 RepID=UPI0039A0ED13
MEAKVPRSRSSTQGLPAETTSFVGRRQEIARVRELLSSARLVTLSGPGGVGKSRVALRLAAQVRRSYSFGVHWVDLCGVSDAQGAVGAIQDALHQDAVPGGTDGAPLASGGAAALIRSLHGRRTLLVLDNCEHLTASLGPLARTLLAALPALQIVATSRRALAVPDEYVLRIAPLGTAGPDVGAAKTLGEAVQLFVQRAAAARGGLLPDGFSHSEAAAVCRRLEGIPLSVELAAARLRVLTCRQILDRLGDRFGLLTASGTARPPRQRSLLSTLEWSFELCSKEEQLLWARLSVFRGSFDLEAVESVCSGGLLPRERILDVVAGLVDASVLVREDDGPHVRYRMLDTLRAYGERHLNDGGDGAARVLGLLHRDYYRNLAGRAEAGLFTGCGGAPGWPQALGREWPNICRAERLSLATPGEESVGLSMAGSLWAYRIGSGDLRQERRRLGRALAGTRPTGSEGARALWVHGWLSLLCGETAGVDEDIARCRAAAGQSAGWGEQLSGLALLFAGAYAQSADALESALDAHRTHGAPVDVWTSRLLLGLARMLDGAADAATDLHRCVTLAAEHGEQWFLPYARWALGLHTWLRGDPRRAAQVLRSALDAVSPGNRLAGALVLESLAWALTPEGHHEEAAGLLGAAHRTRQAIGMVQPGFLRLHHRACERVLRRVLGGDRFEARRQAGGAWTAEQALQHASGASPQPPAGAEPVGPQTVLTRREREVAQLVREGLTDRQIAARLVISPRTAQGHVQNILRKLGFTRRVQVALWLQRRV